MKTLYLMRHGKSDWSAAGGDDHDRPLASRGERAASLMGRHLASRGTPPELILCSTALRTRETLERLSPELSAEPEVEFDTSLYLASASELLDRVAAIADSFQSALVLGHNPGMHDLATRLIRSGDPQHVEQLARKFPTAALACFRFDCAAWSQVEIGTGEIVSFVTPRELE